MVYLKKTNYFMSVILVHVSDFPNMARFSYLKSCLNSLLNLLYDEYEIIVVYNRSTLLEINEISQLDPKISAVNINEQMSVTYARNVGANMAKGDYLIFLDTDTHVDPDWMNGIINGIHSSSTNVGVFGCSQYSYNGLPKYQDIEGTCDVLGSVWDEFTVQKKIPSKYSGFEALGFALIMRKNLFHHIGGYDKRYETQGFDLDLSWRVRLAGYDIVTLRSVKVYHAQGVTQNYIDPKKIYRLERNTLITLLKNYDLRTLILLLPVHIAQLFLEIFLFFLLLRFDLAYCVLNAMYWNITNIRTTWIMRQSAQNIRKINDRKLMEKMLKKNVRAFKFSKYFLP